MIDPDFLLAGPRGRRLVLAYAMASERIAQTDYTQWQLLPAVSNAAYELDPGQGRSRVMMIIGDEEPAPPSASPQDVATALLEVNPAEVTEELLRDSLEMAVSSARYWQEPDGEDVLIATNIVSNALRPFADRIAESPLVNWWTNELDLNDQWTVSWEDDAVVLPECDPIQALDNWRQQMEAAETRAQHDRPSDPAANYSGEWWSIPSPMTLVNSSRSLFDGSPASLWWTEDAAGWQRARTRHVQFPTGVRVLEIHNAETWAELCGSCPLEVTASKRHDWYRTTNRDGRWVMPDWSQVARM